MREAISRLALFLSLPVLALTLGLSSAPANADTSLAGINTDGTLFTVAADGTLTQKATEALASYSLGAFARSVNTAYYIATPSGGTENAIFKASLKTGVISHADLDLASGDDHVYALFLNGTKLYGIFYNSSIGSGSVRRIVPGTGKTSLVVDISDLGVEPIGGAITHFGQYYYFLAHPDSDSTLRSLVRFKLARRSAKSFSVADKNGNPITCDRLKVDQVHQTFLCLASPSSTQVDVCRLGASGRAKCLATLSNVERIAGGHTMMTPDGKTFYAFVYAPGDSNAQRLVRFSASGRLKSTATVNTLIIGARFGADGE